MKQLIILRGNSGSGKTTVARMLQERLGRTTMLLSQDTLRREILRAKDKTNHPGGKLMQVMTRFGWEYSYEIVIIEGIWTNKKYGDELREVIDDADKALVYYFDISFEETLRRHATKTEANAYGEKEMREWWNKDDLLGVRGEKIIDEADTKEGIVDKVLQDIGIMKE